VLGRIGDLILGFKPGNLVTYQPPDRFWTFQSIEAGIFVALTAAALGATIWLLHRRANLDRLAATKGLAGPAPPGDAGAQPPARYQPRRPRRQRLRKLRRSVHRSVTGLEADIRKWINEWTLPEAARVDQDRRRGP
jgi:hypothetical protein